MLGPKGFSGWLGGTGVLLRSDCVTPASPGHLAVHLPLEGGHSWGVAVKPWRDVQVSGGHKVIMPATRPGMPSLPASPGVQQPQPAMDTAAA